MILRTGTRPSPLALRQVEEIECSPNGKFKLNEATQLEQGNVPDLGSDGHGFS